MSLGSGSGCDTQFLFSDYIVAATAAPGTGWRRHGTSGDRSVGEKGQPVSPGRAVISPQNTAACSRKESPPSGNTCDVREGRFPSAAIELFSDRIDTRHKFTFHLSDHLHI